MIRAAVCDDERKVLEDLNKKIIAAFSADDESVETAAFDDPFLLLEHIKTIRPMLFFLT